MDVGFIGLGRMGGAMARNLAKAGHRVRAWNRSPVAGELVSGMDIVASAAGALQADAAFTMLSDDSAIRDVLLSSDVLHRARPGLVHLVTSTISVGFADELRVRHAEAGLGYVSAPVFGRPDAAEAARLDVMVAGEKGAVGKVHPLGLKDLRLAAAAGEKAGRTLPMLDAVRAQMAAAAEAGMGDKDWSAIADYTLHR